MWKQNTLDIANPNGKRSMKHLQYELHTIQGNLTAVNGANSLTLDCLLWQKYSKLKSSLDILFLVVQVPWMFWPSTVREGSLLSGSLQKDVYPHLSKSILIQNEWDKIMLQISEVFRLQNKVLNANIVIEPTNSAIPPFVISLLLQEICK